MSSTYFDRNVDVLIDVQFGDCGKGKISKALIEQNQYHFVNKWNGGPNAGHAVWIGDKKFTAHHLTSGIYDPNAIILIGRGCVVDPGKFLDEVEHFSKHFNLDGRVFIHPATHVIGWFHKNEERDESKIGTTRTGVGPAMSAKYRRTGRRAEDVPELSEFVVDFDSWFGVRNRTMLMEGSQGWWLDIDHGFYPYVTSSHMHPAHAFTSFGIPLSGLRTIYGVGKVYETYVGAQKGMLGSIEHHEEHAIRELGQEYGETTGRPRDIGYLNMERLIEAVNRTGVDVLYLNKMDVLEELGMFNFWYDANELRYFDTVEEFQEEIRSILDNFSTVKEVIFSGNKHGI